MLKHQKIHSSDYENFSLIRANFVGTSFTVYDNGVNPNKGEALPDGSNCRQELAAIIYVSVYRVG